SQSAEKHSRATLITCCFLESSACLPTSVRISSISLSTSFLASSCPRCCTSSFSCRQSLCKISSHWVVCKEGKAVSLKKIVVFLQQKKSLKCKVSLPLRKALFKGVKVAI
uniref:Uncharacterized protein n=1 Tax=Gopherus agassizii TaxID=38772 RepID=A0A452GRL1_9SAUR